MYPTIRKSPPLGRVLFVVEDLNTFARLHPPARRPLDPLRIDVKRLLSNTTQPQPTPEGLAHRRIFRKGTEDGMDQRLWIFCIISLAWASHDLIDAVDASALYVFRKKIAVRPEGLPYCIHCLGAQIARIIYPSRIEKAFKVLGDVGRVAAVADHQATAGAVDYVQGKVFGFTKSASGSGVVSGSVNIEFETEITSVEED